YASMAAARSQVRRGYAGSVSSIRARLARRVRDRQERLRRLAIGVVQRSQRLLSRLRQTRACARHRLRCGAADRRGTLLVFNSSGRHPGDRDDRARLSPSSPGCAGAGRDVFRLRSRADAAARSRGDGVVTDVIAPAVSDRLAGQLDELLTARYGSRPIASVVTRPSIWRSSAEIDEIDVQFDDGTQLELIAKAVAWNAMSAGPARAHTHLV